MTQEELKAIRDQINTRDRYDKTQGDHYALELCDEVERLQEAIKEAGLIMAEAIADNEHLQQGMKEARDILEDTDYAPENWKWLQTYFSTPTCQQREDGGNNHA